MPSSLMDMFQPTNAGGQPAGIGDALQSRSNSLIGLGLGLMSPAWPGQGSIINNALQGYQGGAAQDAAQARFAQQMAHQKTQDARQAAMDKFNMGMRQQEFARGNITDAQRAMADVLGANATPEQKTDFMKSYYGSKTDPGAWVLKDVIDPSDPEGERKITVQEHNRTGQIRPPQVPGQTSTAAVDPFAPGATPHPVYGEVGDFSTPPTAAPAAGLGGQRPSPLRAVTLPNGQVLTAPAGLSKKAKDAWEIDAAKTAADVAAGKMTEAQGTSNLYAGKMAIANNMLDPATEQQGLDVTGNRLEKYGGWAGNVLLMPKDYQRYRDAKDTFLNAYLRRISGATVRDPEYLREEKVFFPQPGDQPTQVEYKRQLREDAIMRMKQQVGPGYKEPPAAPGAAPTATGGGGGSGVVQWTRDAKGNPVPVQ